MRRPRSLTFALSEDYARATGGYIYDQRLVAGLEALGWRIERMALPAGFPRPSEDARRRSAALITDLPHGAVLLTDQLCLGVLPEVAAAEGRRLKLAMIVHHPLAAEGYGPPGVSAGLFASEREALRHAVLVIVTSDATARALAADYQVDRSRMVVAPPGTDSLPLSTGSPGDTVDLLCVGAVVPRKGHDLLIEALSGLGHLPWRLTIAGNLDRQPEHADLVRRSIMAAGLTDRVVLAGEMSDRAIERLWRSADVFVAASRHEGYGMAVAEAIARGLPVVATHAGVIGEWLGSETAEIVPTGDASQLAAALGQVIGDEAHREKLRRRAVAFRSRLASWADTADKVHSRLAGLEAP